MIQGSLSKVLHGQALIVVLSCTICAFSLALPLTIAGANIGWGVVSAAVVLSALINRQLPLAAMKTPQFKLLWAYFAACVIASALGVDPRNSFHFINRDFHKIWLFSLFSIALAIEPAPSAIIAMALGFAAAAAIGIGQEIYYYTHGLASWWRAHAFVHPVVFGEQMAVAVIGAVCFMIGKKNMDPGFRRDGGLKIALLFLLSAALLANNTRAAWAACLIGIGAVFLVLPSMQRWGAAAILGAVVALAGGFYVSEMILHRDWASTQLYELIHYGRFPTQGPLMRLLLWKTAIEMGMDHFWTGIGLNNFRQMFPHYHAVTFQDGTNSWGTADNLYLHQFAERGILGLLALLALFWSFWSRALERARENPNAFNLWAFGAWTAFWVMNLTEVAFQTEIVWMLLIFIWCWAEANHRSRQNSSLEK